MRPEPRMGFESPGWNISVISPTTSKIRILGGKRIVPGCSPTTSLWLITSVWGLPGFLRKSSAFSRRQHTPCYEQEALRPTALSIKTWARSPVTSWGRGLIISICNSWARLGLLPPVLLVSCSGDPHCSHVPGLDPVPPNLHT